MSVKAKSCLGFTCSKNEKDSYYNVKAALVYFKAYLYLFIPPSVKYLNYINYSLSSLLIKEFSKSCKGYYKVVSFFKRNLSLTLELYKDKELRLLHYFTAKNYRGLY
ncbi:hypothetical protein LZ30DRAFT_693247 [Colletotrichum cereale]|nr:hypothetical protein LZ30DRAFT_693247 [Colletotrichum cereale]